LYHSFFVYAVFPISIFQLSPAVISPMLITFLDMDPYMAVGIALASDVLASAASAYTYGNLIPKNKVITNENPPIVVLGTLLETKLPTRVNSKTNIICLHPFSDMNLKPQSEQAFLLWRLLHLPAQSVILQSAALPIGGH